ncbi:MAG TPA: 5-formyltetrahydrofolate cyclo-ligase [Leucothrix mucor]|uniref:5-formyltetrahydrofolate cyclo-ligase n=1 Tax=Leucothrix mucor TaxID=45248 RepID=A0A7V2T1R2_LEUMU|nr:5-formyltetrahydrofolate cyclo-ligase [Leucothrix mucor]
MDKKSLKNKLRSQLQQQRNSLSTVQQALIAQKICQKVSQANCFRNAQHIAFYTPVKGEANPLALQNEAKKSFYLPVLSTANRFHLNFVKIDKNTKYKNNIYAIPEPIYSPQDIIPATQLDLVIMPLVAVDKEGHRMGMGGGYYDRSFAFKLDSNTGSPMLLGFAYDFQLVDKLIAESWDVPLDYIATNREFIEVC